MSIFRKKSSNNDCPEVIIPEIISNDSSNQSLYSELSQEQLWQRELDIEQAHIDNKRSMTECVHDAIPVVTNGIRDIAGFVSECKIMHEKNEQLQMMTNVQLAEITAKYEVTRQYMQQAFGERNKALNSHYSTLDKAIQSNDRDLIIAAMQSISSIVAQSPLQDIEKFTALFNDTSKPLLDF